MPVLNSICFFGQMLRIKQCLRVHEAGMAFNIWNQMQMSKAVFSRMRSTDESFFLLPATIYSDTPELHSTSLVDTFRLAQNLCGLQRIRG